VDPWAGQYAWVCHRSADSHSFPEAVVSRWSPNRLDRRVGGFKCRWFWGPTLKWAGYDCGVCVGASAKPSPSSSPTVSRTERCFQLWGRTRSRQRICFNQQLGQSQWRNFLHRAGRGVLFPDAESVNEKGRIAARSGVGAVIGSKRLKAVAVKGDRKDGIATAHPATLNSIRDKFSPGGEGNGFQQGLSAAGTGGGTSFLVSIALPHKELEFHRTGTRCDMRTPQQHGHGQIQRRGYGCHACPIRCGACSSQGRLFATGGEVHRAGVRDTGSAGYTLLERSGGVYHQGQ